MGVLRLSTSRITGPSTRRGLTPTTQVRPALPKGPLPRPASFLLVMFLFPLRSRSPEVPPFPTPHFVECPRGNTVPSWAHWQSMGAARRQAQVRGLPSVTCWRVGSRQFCSNRRCGLVWSSGRRFRAEMVRRVAESSSESRRRSAPLRSPTAGTWRPIAAVAATVTRSGLGAGL